jgi:hypothetical protein
VAKDRQAAEGSTTDDPRWASPLPLRFEVQLATLFLGALDAHEVTSNVLRNHQMNLGASLAASARARPVGYGSSSASISITANVRIRVELADSAISPAYVEPYLPIQRAGQRRSVARR